MTEVWKTIQENPDYLISNLGNVWSCKSNRLIKPNANTAGYLRVQFGYGSKKYFVHRLVAQAFVKGYFDDAVVNHKDCDKLNNSADNLEWVTRSENSKHAFAQGRQPGSFKFKPYTVVDRQGNVMDFKCATELCKHFGVSKSWFYLKLDEFKVDGFSKCLTTIPDECTGVGDKPMISETACHQDDGRYSLISLEIMSSLKRRRGTCETSRMPMVMGYHRPVSSFNKGKQGEFAERKYFTEDKCKSHCKDE